tara:strand:- start:2042 stop:3235 length:1194 start_codon:yes stop_codon:yes gene_type:complete
MNLREFLKLQKISQKEFAKHLGISPISLTRYLYSKRFPEKKILEKIHKLTDGIVTANDFLSKSSDNDLLSRDDKTYISELLSNIRNCSRVHLAKCITMIESSLEKDKSKTEFLLQKLKPRDNSIRIGITGVPGVGKSTFIESLGIKLIEKGHKVAVLAVDPSSKKTGGSILGDKTRMEKLSINPSAFVRPSPSQGHLGGVAKKTRESILCLEEAGFDIIFIETMGVGQAETAVYDMVDVFLVLLLPSGGDELQGIKKGIIELADLIVVNKADSDLKKTAEITVRDYKTALSIIGNTDRNEKIEVLKCSSLHAEGVDDVWDFISEFINFRISNNLFFENRDDQRLRWLWEIINLKANEFINKNIKKKKITKKIENDVKTGELGLINASRLIFDYFSKK